MVSHKMVANLKFNSRTCFFNLILSVIIFLLRFCSFGSCKADELTTHDRKSIAKLFLRQQTIYTFLLNIFFFLSPFSYNMDANLKCILIDSHTC